jgi:RNA polymerase sigma-70 factor (ECF subfamily)
MSSTDSPSDPGIHLLYLDHHGWLHALLRRKLGCTHTAADLAHDTFLRVLSGRHRASDLREPRAWLRAIARNIVVDHWRRQEIERAWLDSLAALPEAVAPSPEQGQLILEALLEVDAVLRQLPARVRKAFLLSQLDGLTYAEIAAQLRTSQVTIKRYMRTAFIACMSVST